MTVNKVTPLNSNNHDPEKEVTVSIRNMNHSLWKKVNVRALELGMTISEYIQAIVKQELGDEQDSNNEQ
jgi:hypothetical protein